MKKIFARGKKHSDKFAMVDDDMFEQLSSYRWSYANQKGRKTGYFLTSAVVEGKIKTVYMHRMVMSKELSLRKEAFVDHKDGDGTNNQRENLRVVNFKQNAEHRKRLNGNNKSGARGVSWNWDFKKWDACVMHNRKKIKRAFFDLYADAVEFVENGRAELGFLD